jgi:sec-independent protein translocase protein TatA
MCDNNLCSRVFPHAQSLQGEFTMGDLFTAPHLIFLGILAVLLFGGKKLPELGKGLGEGLRGFKDGMKGISDDDAADQKKKDDEQKMRADMEAKAYQEAKMAAEAKVAAEARLAAEQKARENEVVIK